MCYGLKFEEAFENKADVNTLLKTLDTTIQRIVRRFYKKFSFYIDHEDIAQEVRLHLWHIIEHTDYLKEMTGEEAYKYLYTAMIIHTFRTIKRQSAKVKRQNKIGKESYVTLLTLSVFNSEYLDNPAEISGEVIVNRLKEACKDIEHIDVVFDYLAPTEDLGRKGKDDVKDSGLPINTFYKIVGEIRERAKEISYE